MGKTKELILKIKEEIKNGKTVVAQLAPAVRVSIGEEFGLEVGLDLTGKTISLLKKLGFYEVVDTPLGADLLIYEEASQFAEMIKKGKKFSHPHFNSCCVGWRRYCKQRYPEIYNQLGLIVSPMMAIGSVVKYYMGKKIGKKPEEIIVVGIMPCSLKKYETLFRNSDGIKYVDYVITTSELGDWARKEELDIKDMEPGKFSEYLPCGSRSGTIFGVTGGLTEAFLNQLSVLLKEEPDEAFRKNESIREKTVEIGKMKLNTAIVYGLSHFENIMKELKQGKNLQFIEVMACPMGCVGGPGQTLPFELEKIKKRGKGMRGAADAKESRVPSENPIVQRIYKEWLGEAGSAEAVKHLHFNWHYERKHPI